MEYINAKNIVSSNGYFGWFGNKYNMNIYRGCSHGCIYCDSRSSCYQIKDFDKIKAKNKAISIIEKELKIKRKTGIIGTGAMSDPYNPYERKYEFTKKSLNLVNRYKFGINITTKSDLVTRDINVFKKINIHSPVLIGITITANNDYISKKIEPYAPLSSHRFKAIKTLSENGIYVGIVMTPILPFITDTKENIYSLVKRAKECKAKFIYPYFGVTLRRGQREYFYLKLDKYFPEMKEKYKKTYGYRYECDSLKKDELGNFFVSLCEKYDIKYKMDDIIKEAKNNIKTKQLSLF